MAPPFTSPYSPETKEGVKRDYIEGRLTNHEIAAKWGVKRDDTIRQWARTNGWRRKNAKPEVILRPRDLQAAAPSLPSYGGRQPVVLDFDPQQLEIQLESHIKKAAEEIVEKALARHMAYARQLMQHGLIHLPNITPRSISDILALINAGIQLERQARGLETRVSGMAMGNESKMTGDSILSYVEKRLQITKKQVKEHPEAVKIDPEDAAWADAEGQGEGGGIPPAETQSEVGPDQPGHAGPAGGTGSIGNGVDNTAGDRVGG